MRLIGSGREWRGTRREGTRTMRRGERGSWSNCGGTVCWGEGVPIREVISWQWWPWTCMVKPVVASGLEVTAGVGSAAYNQGLVFLYRSWSAGGTHSDLRASCKAALGLRSSSLTVKVTRRGARRRPKYREKSQKRQMINKRK